MVLAVQSSPVFQTICFSRVPSDPAGCVGCKRHTVGKEFSNKITNVVDFVFGGLFSKVCSPKTVIQATKRYLCEATQVLTKIFWCRAGQGRAVRISSPNLANHASMNVRTLCVYSLESWSAVPFNKRGCPIPFVSTMAAIVRSHRSQSLNQCASLLLSCLSSG